MAQFHMHIQVIGGGRSAVAASAYRSGEKLKDRETGKTHDYTHKQGVAYTRILLPENAPAEFADRETLWNKVQEAEKKNPNAQYSRELEASLPKELSFEQQKEIVETYCQGLVQQGMCVDYAIELKEGNPHVHIMTTMGTAAINREKSLRTIEMKMAKQYTTPTSQAMTRRTKSRQSNTESRS